MPRSTRNWTPRQHAVAREIAHRKGWIGHVNHKSRQRSSDEIEAQRASVRRDLTDNAQMLADATGISLEAAIAKVYPDGIDQKVEECLKRTGWVA